MALPSDKPAPRRKVFVSGCFDLLHSGHVAFLQEAASYGDLYVGIGSDLTIYELKGRYTVNSEAERRYMIRALACVTDCRVNSGRGIIDFEQEVHDIQPDILVTNEDGHSPAKEAFCRAKGLEYRVLKREPHPGLPRAIDDGAAKRMPHSVPDRPRRRMARPAIRVEVPPWPGPHHFDRADGRIQRPVRHGVEHAAQGRGHVAHRHPHGEPGAAGEAALRLREPARQAGNRRVAGCAWHRAARVELPLLRRR